MTERTSTTEAASKERKRSVASRIWTMVLASACSGGGASIRIVCSKPGRTYGCEKINRPHTHTPTENNNTPDTDTHTHDKNNTPNPQPNTPHKHITTLEGGATTVRATSHARVG